MKQIAGLIISVLILASCDPTTPPADGPDIPSLHEVYQDAFMIGTAMNHRQVSSDDPRGAALARMHFNAVTSENEMKWENIHPEPGQYDFDAADAFIRYAEENDMFVVGHTLVWHRQTPRWVFEDEDGSPNRLFTPL